MQFLQITKFIERNNIDSNSSTVPGIATLLKLISNNDNYPSEHFE